MNESLGFIVAVVVGAAAGWVYFYGLWFTVRRLPHVRHAPLWLMLSLLLRLALMLVALYWIGRNNWLHWVAALVGVIAVRLFMSRRIGRGAEPAAQEPAGRSPS